MYTKYVIKQALFYDRFTKMSAFSWNITIHASGDIYNLVAIALPRNHKNCRAKQYTVYQYLAKITLTIHN